jgi:hypothetical protein
MQKRRDISQQLRTVNRRDSDRNQIDCLIRLEPLGITEHPATEGIVQDASASGAQIWAERPFVVGERLRLRFGCAKAGLTEETSCQATVVWANAEPLEGRWQMGIRFQEDEASQTISDALARGCPWCEKLCPEIAVVSPG